jgi:hypothetical protein
MFGAATKLQPSGDSADRVAENEIMQVTPDMVLSEFGEICVGISVSGALIAVRELTGLRCTVSFGKGPSVGSRVAGDAAFTMHCIETGEVMVCEDAANDLRFGPLIAERMGFLSAAAVPIEAQGSVVGVIEVFCPAVGAITDAVVADLKRVAKGFAALMIFDAANGGPAIVGGPVQEPIELPRLTDAEAAAESEESSTISLSLVEEPTESGELASSEEGLADASMPPRIADAKSAVMDASPVASVSTNLAAGESAPVPGFAIKVKKAASLSPLPSDRRTPNRVWLIAGVLLFALSLLLLFLYLSGSRRANPAMGNRSRTQSVVRAQVQANAMLRFSMASSISALFL